MKKWVQRVRGWASLTAIGGGLGAAFGGLWTAASLLLAGLPISGGVIAMGAALYAGFGAVAVGGVGITLATLGAGKRLSELSAVKAGFVGLILGGAVPLIGLIGVGAGAPLAAYVSVALRFGLLGGTLGAGLVAVAKRSEAKELEAAPEQALLAGE